MVTQLLFGEHFEVLEDPDASARAEKKSWALIRIAYDDYECWIDKKQFLPLSNEKGLSDFTTAVTTDLLQLAEHESGSMIPLPLGSSLPNFKNNSFSFGKEKYSFEGEATFPFSKKKVLPKGEVPIAIGIEGASLWYLNTPYLWGGRSPFGLDCSGFTQLVFKLNGIKLKRDAWQQGEQGKTLSFVEEAQTGDLAFFDNQDGKIVHVGIITSPLNPLSHGRGEKGAGVERGEAKIIHASGKVRIDKLDHHGIYNEEQKEYTHRLRVIKRFI